MLHKIRTKIVCTIGPASSSDTVLKQMINSGMSVARLNMSHGSFDDHARYVETLRTVEDSSRPLALLMDLPALKYRTGPLKDGKVLLEEGQEFTLTAQHMIGDSSIVSVNAYSLVTEVKAGDDILVGDGELTFCVEQVLEDAIKCRVVVGGVLKEDRGLVVPGSSHTAPYINDTMLAQIDFAMGHGIDYLALSLIRNEEDVKSVKKVLEQKGTGIPIVSKIETAEAVQNLDGIISASEGIMVARGDLGMELPLEKVPMIQKQIVAKCNRFGRPVIVATQMLESMIHAPQPTRAEVADVANAVFDGTDAVMLSAETSVGSYPQAAAAMMSRIMAEAEHSFPYQQKLLGRGSDLVPQVDDAIAFAACHTAHQLGAKLIIAFTESGSTALRVAKYRPSVPIVGFTSSDAVRKKMALVWGVQAYKVSLSQTIEDMFSNASKTALGMGLVNNGDLVVITGGSPLGTTGTTNLLKVHVVE
ncbi:MAG: pyruvate kinase [Deltaproteobacteria bacterium]|nr:pyruvate kinase [Deltaproteobacteria bacterium]